MAPQREAQAARKKAMPRQSSSKLELGAHQALITDFFHGLVDNRCQSCQVQQRADQLSEGGCREALKFFCRGTHNLRAANLSAAFSSGPDWLQAREVLAWHFQVVSIWKLCLSFSSLSRGSYAACRSLCMTFRVFVI